MFPLDPAGAGIPLSQNQRDSCIHARPGGSEGVKVTAFGASGTVQYCTNGKVSTGLKAMKIAISFKKRCKFTVRTNGQFYSQATYEVSTS